MNQDLLAEAIQRPSLHEELLGDYKGAYALGVTKSPENAEHGALLLRVEEEAPEEIPTHIAVDGERVTVIVKRGFKAPRRL